MKRPISEKMCSVSMLVPHDAAENLALASATVDKGLQPNGITIDMMRENPEFYKPADLLDRCAVAAQTSAKLSDDVKKVVRAIKSSETDRNKPKNFL